MLLPISRVYAIPPECRDAFMWLMHLCKDFAIDVSNVTFTSTQKGRFIKAEGDLRLRERTATFLVSDCDGSMSIHINIQGELRYRIYHAHAPQPYPLDALMEARSREEADALAEAMGSLLVV